jgi:hypothetical protein
VNVHDEMSEEEVLRAAASSLSAIPMAESPDPEAIMARGRARRRRRLTGLGLAGTAAVGAVALGVAGVLGGGPAIRATGTIRTAAFTLVKNANGTATLTLSQDQLLNPSTLQRSLARDGIPALVKSFTYCWSDPAPASPAGVVSFQLPDGRPVAKSSYPGQHPVPPSAVAVINPAVMPAGTELFFNYVNGPVLSWDLIYTNSHTCLSGLPPAPGYRPR